MKNFILLVIVMFQLITETNSQTIKLIGNDESNENRVVKFFDGYVYEGYRDNGSNGIVLKMDLEGNVIWTAPIGADFTIRDIAKSGPVVMIVGSSLSPSSSIAKIIDNGSSYSLEFSGYFDIEDRDAFSKIIVDPSNSGQFLIQHYFKGSLDDVAIITIDLNGNVLATKYYDFGDDQFWSGLKSGESTLTLVGNMGGGGQGCYVELNNILTTNKAYKYSNVFNIYDYADLSNNRKLIVGSTYSNPPKGFVALIDNFGNSIWGYSIDESYIVTQIIHHSTQYTSNATIETYYLLGYYIDGGSLKHFIQKIKSSVNSGGPASIALSKSSTKNMVDVQEIEWTRHFDDSSLSHASASAVYNQNRIIYTDHRTNTSRGHGQSDVLFTNVDMDLTSCLTVDLDFQLTSMTLSPVELSGAEGIITLPEIQGVENFGPDVNYSYNNLCYAQDCYVDSINISTGYNHLSNSIYATGNQDSYWKVVSFAPTSEYPDITSANYQAYVISKNEAWAEFEDESQWISAFRFDNLTQNNPPGTAPYGFEHCFCVAENMSTVQFDFSVLSDDYLSIDLLNEEGLVQHNLLTQPIPGSRHTNFKKPIVIDTSFVLDQGKYCIRANVRNGHGVAMGFNLSGHVKGASFLDYGCCHGYTGNITGMKYHDKNCNGNFDGEGNEVGLANWEIVLCDSIGNPIDTVLTNSYGNYQFSDIPVGEYQVKEINQPDWEQTAPNNNVYIVSLDSLETVNRIDFGNKFIGPITTNSFDYSCVSKGESIKFSWEGQECDCDIQIFARPCGSQLAGTVVTSVPNSGTYSWSVNQDWTGDYEFYSKDCDGNEIPFEGCVSFENYGVDISYIDFGCGEFEFYGVLSDLGESSILNYSWTFPDLVYYSDERPIHDFESSGTYPIVLTLTTTDNCQISDTIEIDVISGHDCVPCPVNVLQEIDNGDLFIYQSCYGVILQSPNGNCFRIKVKDNGELYAQGIPCPE